MFMAAGYVNKMKTNAYVTEIKPMHLCSLKRARAKAFPRDKQ